MVAILTKIWGLTQFAAAIIIGLHFFLGMFSQNIVLIVALYILIWAGIFVISSKDVASIIDVIAAVYILLANYGIFHNATITIAVIVWLAQKAFFAMISF